MKAKINGTKNCLVHRALFSIMLSAGILTAVAEPAAAHKYEFRPIVSSHYYYRYGNSVLYPRWLRKNRDFQRWYLRSNYCCSRRYIHRANWDRLYDMYVFEKRHQRRAYRRFRGRGIR